MCIYIKERKTIMTMVDNYDLNRRYCCRLLRANIKENHFSFVIIDEASQAIEPETLIPFLVACMKEDENKGLLQAQVVIAGDPCQLGPPIRSKLAEPLLGNIGACTFYFSVIDLFLALLLNSK